MPLFWGLQHGTLSAAQNRKSVRFGPREEEHVPKIAAVLAVLIALLWASATIIYAQEPMRPLSPPDQFLIRIRLLHGDEAAKVFMGPGAGVAHGREFGPAVRAAVRRGEIKPYPGRFEYLVELRNFTFDQMRGATIRLSRAVRGERALVPHFIPEDFGTPDRFGRLQNAVTVEVLNGEGWLEIRVPWVGDDGSLVTHAPESLFPLLRPKSPGLAMMTCTRQLVAANRCGSFPNMGMSELANLVRYTPERVTDIIFVK